MKNYVYATRVKIKNCISCVLFSSTRATYYTQNAIFNFNLFNFNSDEIKGNT